MVDRSGSQYFIDPPTPTLLVAMLTSRLDSRSGASRPCASVALQPPPRSLKPRPQNDARSLADGPHTRTLVGRLWQDARRDVALARTAPPQMEQIHPPRAGVRLGVKSIGVPASGTRYPRRQEPTPTREPNPGHFSLPSNVVSGMRPVQRLLAPLPTKPVGLAAARVGTPTQVPTDL
jgi:hypothetical protein